MFMFEFHILSQSSIDTDIRLLTESPSLHHILLLFPRSPSGLLAKHTFVAPHPMTSSMSTCSSSREVGDETNQVCRI